jgi:hypothetical protein
MGLKVKRKPKARLLCGFSNDKTKLECAFNGKKQAK